MRSRTTCGSRRQHGHSAAIYGTPIWYVPELQFSMDIQKIRPGRLCLRVGAVPHQAAARSDHAGQVPAAASADPGYGRNVQPSGHCRRVRLQPSQRGRTRPVDRACRRTERQDHANHARAADQSARRVRCLSTDTIERSRLIRRGASEAVRHSSCRSQLVAVEAGVHRAVAGDSSRSAIRSVRSDSSGCGGTPLLPRDQPPVRKRRSSRIPERSGGFAFRPPRP